jgi:FtsZ-binding cell division protein ZapB
MREFARWLTFAALAAAAASGAVPQSPPPSVPLGPAGAAAQQASPSQEPRQEALAWDRDFDLLLELRDAPTRAEVEAAARRQALTEERDRLSRHLADLQSRLDALQGTYSTETLLNEMLRQGVSDMQTVVANLNREIKAAKSRIAGIDDRLKRFYPQPGAKP